MLLNPWHTVPLNNNQLLGMVLLNNNRFGMVPLNNNLLLGTVLLNNRLFGMVLLNPWRLTHLLLSDTGEQLRIHLLDIHHKQLLPQLHPPTVEKRYNKC